MGNFNKLSRTEMKTVLGGLLPHPKDEVECMSKSTGDECGGDVAGICSKVYDYRSKDYYLVCDFAVTVPEP